ncbi:MAG: hypothetical protein RL379_354 [Bacillota bacterium]|jgi:hypothetical protein
MNEIVRFLLGIGVIVVLIAAYAMVTNVRRKTIAASQLESCDTNPQGGCCGQHDACSFEAKVQKIDGSK